MRWKRVLQNVTMLLLRWIGKYNHSQILDKMFWNQSVHYAIKLRGWVRPAQTSRQVNCPMLNSEVLLAEGFSCV